MFFGEGAKHTPVGQRRDMAERMESRLGLHQLEYMAALGMGSREYNLIEI